MEATAEPIRAAIYTRISDDREGTGFGVQRQLEDCEKRAASLGWHVVATFCDNNLSAFNSKSRDGYVSLVQAIEYEHIDALVLWHTDRLHRNVRQLLDFLDVVRERDKQHPDAPFIIETVQSGQIDLSTPTGRAMAITFGAWAEQSSGQKAVRIRRKIQQLVEKGMVHNGGPRPYGFHRIYQGEGPRRKIVRDEIDEDEAEIIRECKDRVLRTGDSMHSIVVELNRRGLRTSTGKMWSHQALRLMLMSGRIAGLKEHHRQVVGKAAWPAIITEDEHRRLRAALASKGRHPFQLNRRYFLTGLVWCTCVQERSRPMKVNKAHDKMVYTCQPKAEGGCGGRSINLEQVEKLVSKWVIKRASDLETLKELAEREAAKAGAANEVLAAIEKDERRLTLLQAQLADDAEDELPELVAAARKVRARLGGNRDKLARLSGAPSLVGIDLAELERRWNAPTGSPEGLTLDRKCALARVFIEKVIIHPAKYRGRVDLSRVEIVPK